MLENNATILIPDISGFTAFMTSTELSHSSRAINILIDSILTAVGDEYALSEIEGDAVLLIRKGLAPSKKEIQETCIRIFNAFHFRRRWMQEYTVCPCRACLAIMNLSLKFIVHHGPVAEIRAGGFVKQSGPEMIVAHRLLKNRIGSNEYVLISDKLLMNTSDQVETTPEMAWISAFEEYDSIGKISYRYALLDGARMNVPQPPPPPTHYIDDSTPFDEIQIASNFLDVYMTVMNIPARHQWIPSLKGVEQEIPDVFKGSVHYCKFEDHEAIISPLQMTLADDCIVYAESCRVNSMNLSLVHEFQFKQYGDKQCSLSFRAMDAGQSETSDEIRTRLAKEMQKMAQNLKLYCEKTC